MKTTNLLLKVGLMVLVLGCWGKVAGQATGDYRSFTSGTWATAANWERWDGTSWINPAPAAPSSSDGVITILNGHTMTIGVEVSIDQVVINSSGQLTINSTIAVTLANGTGVDLDCSGTFLNSGIVTWTGTMTIQSSGTYIHNTSSSAGNALDKTTLSSGSTWVYRGSSSLTPASSFSGRTYENLSFECTSGSYSINMNGTNALTINGDFTVGSGVTLNNNMTATNVFAGNFTNNGTITNNGTDTQIYSFTGVGKTIGGSTATAFETFSNSASASTTLSSNISIASTFTGTVNGILGCGTSIVSGSGTFSLLSGGTIKTSNSAGINSTGSTGSIQTTTRTFNSGANYEFQGAATGTFTTTPTGSTVNNLTINNTGGNVSLGQVLSVAGALTLTAGKLNLNGNPLTVSTISGGSSTSYIVAESTTPVIKATPSSFIFPIGTSSDYMPCTLTGTGTYSVYLSTTASGFSDPSYALTNQWDITRTGGSGTISAAFQWPTAVQGGNFPGTLYLFKNTAGTWSNVAGPVSAGGGDPNSASFTGVTCCSGFVPGGEQALPVELVDFRANLLQKSVHLAWLTYSETNNDYFSIEKSTDGQTFREIGQVAGQGTSYEVNDYQVIDDTPAPGLNYYRLRQVDFDGQFSFSPVVSVYFGSDKGSVSMFPSIVQESATILFPEETEETGMVYLFDQTGRLVSELEVQAGMLEVSLPTSRLPAGQYFVKVQTGQVFETHRITKL